MQALRDRSAATRQCGEFVTGWSGTAAAATISLLPIIVVFLLPRRPFQEIAGAVVVEF